MDHREEHPVWSVYDGLRKARLNVKYYCHFLDWEERKAHFVEIVLAITAPASAFTGLILFKSDTGKIVWQCIAAVSGLTAVARPWMTKRIKEYEATISAYRALESDFEGIRQKVRIRGKYDADPQKEFFAALDRAKQANAAAPKTRENRKLTQKYTAEVNSELPPQVFYIPPVQNEVPKTKTDGTATRSHPSADVRSTDETGAQTQADGTMPGPGEGAEPDGKPVPRTAAAKVRDGKRAASPPAPDTDKGDGN